MRPVSPNATRYDTATIVLHWLTAILVAAQWLGAQTIDWFPRGPLRVDARSLHITFGVLLAIILLVRIAWRLTRGRQLPPADTGPLQLLSKAVHWALYALVAAMILVGLALAWTRGDSIFNLFSIPAFDPGNKALAEQVGDIHETIGWIIIATAGLHAAGALFHRVVLKDGVLGRMLTSG
jgi:cytochrome b561